MNTRKVIDITIKSVYFFVTGFLCLLMCIFLYGYVAYIIDPNKVTPNVWAASSLETFTAHTIVSFLVNFYNKKYSRISFILALISLAMSVLFYNHIFIFQPNMYPFV